MCGRGGGGCKVVAFSCISVANMFFLACTVPLKCVWSLSIQ